MNKILFAWDFHGVLEKGNELAVIDIVNKIMKENCYSSRLDLKTCLELYGKTWKEFMKHVSGITDEEILKNFVLRARELSYDIIRKFVKQQDYSHEVLSEIKEKGHSNIVVSGTDPIRLKDFVYVVGITEFIDEMIGVDRHVGKDIDLVKAKSESIRKYAEENGFSKIVVIGDNEDFDIGAGKLIGAKTFLFVDKPLRLFGGDDKEKYFSSIKTKADYKITDLREILKEV